MKAFAVIFGSIVAVALVMVALWAWIDASSLAADAANPAVMRGAAKALAVSAAAGAQVVALTLVVRRLYARHAAHDALRLLAAIVCSLSAVIAAALGLAGRS